MEWLLAPIDATRAHDVGLHLSWHARAMVLAWGVLAPLGVVAARFFKVLPWQNWPHELDNRAWWISHRASQYTALALTLLGLGLILSPHTPPASLTGADWIHRVLGWAMLALGATQYLSGWARGSKGGPTDSQGTRGDHYDMTRRRLLFERWHKSTGYLVLILAAAAILSGLWEANAPRWMWIAISAWWAALLGTALWCTHRYPTVPTYQAIWGPSEQHPGNQTGKPDAGPLAEREALTD